MVGEGAGGREREGERGQRINRLHSHYSLLTYCTRKEGGDVSPNWRLVGPGSTERNKRRPKAKQFHEENVTKCHV